MTVITITIVEELIGSPLLVTDLPALLSLADRVHPRPVVGPKMCLLFSSASNYDAVHWYSDKLILMASQG